MATYGYDGRHLFLYDGKIHYKGVCYPPPETRLVGDKEVATQLTGSYFLSGRKEPAFNVWSDGEQAIHVLSRWSNGEVKHTLLKEPGAISHLVPVCVSGPIVRQPDMMRQFCDTFWSASIFACPIVEELAALGVTVDGVEPRRAFVPSPYTDELSFDSQEYDENLDGDCYGRMAALVRQGMAVDNQIYNGPGAWPFYGSILANKVDPDIEVPTFMVKSKSMVKYFPDTVVSAKNYAATTVPVLMRASDEFKKSTGCSKDMVSVVVSSEFIPGSPEFMRFYQLFSGKDWIGLTKAVVPFKTMPVFRYNKAYRIPAVDYVEMKNESKEIL